MTDRERIHMLTDAGDNPERGRELAERLAKGCGEGRYVEES